MDLTYTFVFVSNTRRATFSVRPVGNVTRRNQRSWLYSVRACVRTGFLGSRSRVVRAHSDATGMRNKRSVFVFHLRTGPVRKPIRVLFYRTRAYGGERARALRLSSNNFFFCFERTVCLYDFRIRVRRVRRCRRREELPAQPINNSHVFGRIFLCHLIYIYLAVFLFSARLTKRVRRIRLPVSYLIARRVSNRRGGKRENANLVFSRPLLDRRTRAYVKTARLRWAVVVLLWRSAYEFSAWNVIFFF